MRQFPQPRQLRRYRACVAGTTTEHSQTSSTHVSFDDAENTPYSSPASGRIPELSAIMTHTSTPDMSHTLSCTYTTPSKEAATRYRPAGRP